MKAGVYVARGYACCSRVYCSWVSSFSFNVIYQNSKDKARTVFVIGSIKQLMPIFQVFINSERGELF